MARALILLACLLSVGCASTFTDASKLSCTMTRKVTDGHIRIRTAVRNQSSQTVTLVRHPDFYSISVQAANREKDEAVNIPMIHFERATGDDLVKVPPGGSIVFEESIEYDRPSPTVVKVYEPYSLKERGYMRIWDSQLKATFHYGKYPDYLPENAWMLGRNYVMADLNAEIVFPAP